MSEFYRFRWTIRLDSKVPRVTVPVRIITLAGMSVSVMACADGDSVDVVGCFGTDLCIHGGYAVLDQVTNEVPGERTVPGAMEALVPIDETCRPRTGG